MYVGIFMRGFACEGFLSARIRGDKVRDWFVEFWV